jgi:hypothetical protein
MLSIKQFEGDLYMITYISKDNKVRFNGLFKQVDGISNEALLPAENGLSLEIEGEI